MTRTFAGSDDVVGNGNSEFLVELYHIIALIDNLYLCQLGIAASHNLYKASCCVTNC